MEAPGMRQGGGGCLKSGELISMGSMPGSVPGSPGQGSTSHLQNILPVEWSHSGKTCRPDQPIHSHPTAILGTILQFQFN